MSSDVMFIPKRMHRSRALRELTASSVFVLFEFLSRCQMVKIGRRDRWIIKNNGEIVLTYAEITTRFGIARSTFRNSIDQLVKFGFIDIAHHGGKEEFIKKSRKKDTRGLGFTKKN